MEPQLLSQELIVKVPKSKWYRYTLQCMHKVYSTTRIGVPKSWMLNYIQCPQCPVGETRPTTKVWKGITWQGVVGMEPITDEQVSNVSSGSAFIVPGRIMRLDGGNPFPYTSKSRDYD